MLTSPVFETMTLQDILLRFFKSAFYFWSIFISEALSKTFSNPNKGVYQALKFGMTLYYENQGLSAETGHEQWSYFQV